MSLRQTARVLILLTCIQCTYHQGQPVDPSQLDPSKFDGNNKEGDRTDILNQNRPQSGQLQFYMDSTSDCSPVIRETGDRHVIVYGRGATQSGASPLTCELGLRVDQPRDPKRYRISLLTMDIRDCNVQFYIYDGTKEQSLLGRYGCPQNTDTNYKTLLWTSGNQLTFYISRRSREQTNYDIRIQVEPIGGDTEWSTWTTNPEYNRYYKFEQKWVVLIVGLIYAFIAIMTLLLLAICYCCIKGDGDKWQQSRFGVSNPGLTGTGTKSTLNGAKPIWSSSKPLPANGTSHHPQRNGSLRKTPVNVKKRMAGGSEDIDSVFESDGAVNKRPPVKNYPPRQSVPQSRGVHQRNGRSTGNFGRNTDDSFVQADDDHPQDLFVQREIIIPAKKKLKYRKEEEYSSEEELSSGGEEIEKVSSAMNTDPEMKDGGVQYSEQEESEGSEGGTESDEPEPSVIYAKTQKNLAPVTPTSGAPPPTKGAEVPRHARPRTPLGEMDEYVPQYPASGQGQQAMHQPDYRRPGDSQPDYHQPGYGQPDHRQLGYGQPDYHQPGYGQPDYRQPGFGPPDYGGPQSAPYGYHPSDVPSQPSQADYHPSMAPPPYQTSGRYPRYTPEPYYPTYEDNQYHPRPGGRPDPRRHYPAPETMPNDPPIYSYLVRRGYNPVEGGRQSPGSSNNSLENRLEESDVAANIDSGVEIMRR